MLFVPKFITSIVSLQPQKFSRVMFSMKAQNFNFLIILLYSIKFVLLCTDVYYQGDDIISLKISLMEDKIMCLFWLMESLVFIACRYADSK